MSDKPPNIHVERAVPGPEGLLNVLTSAPLSCILCDGESGAPLVLHGAVVPGAPELRFAADVIAQQKGVTSEPGDVPLVGYAVCLACLVSLVDRQRLHDAVTPRLVRHLERGAAPRFDE